MIFDLVGAAPLQDVYIACGVLLVAIAIIDRVLARRWSR